MSIIHDFVILAFSCIAASFALVNVVLSCMKMGGHGDYEHRTKATIRIAATLSLVSMGLYVGMDVLFSPIFGYSRGLLWTELALFSICGNLLTYSVIIHAQFRLAFYICNRKNETLRQVALALFVLPQLLNLVYFIMVQFTSIGYRYNYDGDGYEMIIAIRFLVMLANVFVWCASIYSLVVYIMFWRRGLVVFRTGIGGCLLAANILAAIRHTWSAILYIIDCAFIVQRDRFMAYPRYFDLGTRVVVLWTAPVCILFLILTARKCLWGSDASPISERRDAVPVPSAQVPAPVHDSRRSEPVKTTWA